METSRLMETRRRFREIYGGPETHDYGSMENFANAHREYIRQMKEHQRAQRELEDQRRELDALRWFLTGVGLPGMTPGLRFDQQQSQEQTLLQAQELARQLAQQRQEPPIEAVQFETASFMRRLFAEFIDFLFFLAFKIFVIGALIELDLIDLKTLGQALDDDQDMMQFINLAQELLPIEIVCKIFCCFLEGLIMAQGMGPIACGQTPGKWLAGIRVISCSDVQRGETADQVIVEGPNLISWQQSMKRSFMKNVVVNSLFPLSTAAFQVNNGRVFYDLVVKTVVVMEFAG